MTLGELQSLLKKLPRLDEELDAFASDIADISIKKGKLISLPFFTFILKG
jgi:uncharacterized protein (UPF0335 family)